MRPAIHLFFLLLVNAVLSIPSFATSYIFQSIKVELPDSSKAASIIGQSDDYTKSLTPFDLKARMRTTGNASEQMYLAKAMKEVRTWNAEEQTQIGEGLKELENFLDKNQIKLNLPKQIYIIKSTCNEEFGAEGYTRRNFIVLNNTQESVTEGLIAHELFHVYSRYNKDMRNKLYKVIGFLPCNPINYASAVNNQAITNPDCPVVEHYTTLNGQDVILALYSPNPYKGENVLQDNVDIGLIALTGDNQNKKPLLTDGKATIYGPEKMAALFERTGGNTQYVLHPEEVCAEHFAMLVTNKKVPEPKYLEEMKMILQKK